MIKAAWMTDIHLNFLAENFRQSFYRELNNGIDIALITGDIAESPSVVKILEEMHKSFKKPIYFVLGNHDFYEGSVAQTREDLRKMCKSNGFFLNYLTQESAIRFGKTILVGVDGFADSREGNYYASSVKMNDHMFIEDYRNQAEDMNPRSVYYDNSIRAKIAAKMKELADADAKTLETQIRGALGPTKGLDGDIIPNINRCIVLTHIPPFKENALYRGEPSDDDHLPFYVSKATGDVLLKCAKDWPHVQFDVFCGHSHCSALYKHTPNLIVECSGADYMSPQIQKIIEIEDA